MAVAMDDTLAVTSAQWIEPGREGRVAVRFGDTCVVAAGDGREVHVTDTVGGVPAVAPPPLPSVTERCARKLLVLESELDSAMALMRTLDRHASDSLALLAACETHLEREHVAAHAGLAPLPPPPAPPAPAPSTPPPCSPLSSGPLLATLVRKGTSQSCAVCESTAQA